MTGTVPSPRFTDTVGDPVVATAMLVAGQVVALHRLGHDTRTVTLLVFWEGQDLCAESRVIPADNPTAARVSDGDLSALSSADRERDLICFVSGEVAISLLACNGSGDVTPEQFLAEAAEENVETVQRLLTLADVADVTEALRTALQHAKVVLSADIPLLRAVVNLICSRLPRRRGNGDWKAATVTLTPDELRAILERKDGEP